MNSSKVYCFSGLGADFVAFKNLRLHAEMIPVEWVRVEKKESFTHYCERLIQQLDLSKPLQLMGLSFGGVVAQSIASMLSVERCVLISTIRHPAEFPLLYRSFAFLQLYKAVPEFLLNKYHPLLGRAFGIASERQHEIFKKVMNKTDTQFAKWAIEKILCWQPPDTNISALRLHGTLDNVIPYPKKDTATVAIDRGSHLMIMNRARELSDRINNYLV